MHQKNKPKMRSFEEVAAAWKENDERPEAVELFENIKKALPDLEKLRGKCDGHWGGEGGFYRFYHQSLKVFGLQYLTEEVVKALTAIVPAPVDRKRHKFWGYHRKGPEDGGFDPANPPVLHPWFTKLVAEGTGKEFELAYNEKWLVTTRPIVEAFFHARYFLEMIVKYGKELDAPPNMLPNGWAAVLYLYDLR